MIKEEGSSLRSAAAKCKIPYSTLLDKVRTNSNTVVKKKGHIFLTVEEENSIESWLKICSRFGYARPKKYACSSAKRLLDG